VWSTFSSRFRVFDSKPIAFPEVLGLPRHTSFRLPLEVADLTIHDAHAALVTNEERNQQIVGDVIQAVREGRTPLVLTNRTDHLLATGIPQRSCSDACAKVASFACCVAGCRVLVT
jgi:hypothetical protein